MKKIVLFLLFLFCCSGVRADLLDDVSRQIDLLEKEYWRSQHNLTGDYRNGVERRLQQLVTNVLRITKQMQREGKSRVADLRTPAVSLQVSYGKIRNTTIKRFSLTFQGTSMRDYSKEYRTLIRDKEEKEAEEQEKSGKKTKRTRSRSRRVTPTLANVDIVEYERWLAEVLAANMDKFVNRKNNGSNSERIRMNEAVTAYLSDIQKLRIGLVKVRQQVKKEFK